MTRLYRPARGLGRTIQTKEEKKESFGLSGMYSLSGLVQYKNTLDPSKEMFFMFTL